jgi:hypothetical protein
MLERIIKFRTFAVTAFLFSWVFCCPNSPNAGSQERAFASDSLLQKTVSVRMYDVYAPQVLDFLATEFVFPTGIEIAPSHDDKKISVNIFQQPLRVALDAIVKDDPDYKWEVNDGVVNLLPKNDSDSLLGIGVKSFQVRDMSRLETRRAIAALPEVSAKLKSLGLEFTEINLWPTRDKRDQMRLTIDMRDTTLKAILNEIAKKTNGWGISRFGEFVFIRI